MVKKTKRVSALVTLLLAAFASASFAGGPPCPPDPNETLQALNPPAEITETVTFPVPLNTFFVQNIGELWNAIEYAPSGSRIVVMEWLYGSTYVIPFDKDLIIEGSDDGQVIEAPPLEWGEYFGPPTFSGGGTIVFRNLTIIGSAGFTGTFNRSPGTPGQTAVAVHRAMFTNCDVRGGMGGNSGDGSIGVPAPDGGDGGYAVEGGQGGVVADAQTTFRGGDYGYGGWPHLPDTCCYGCPGKAGIAAAGVVQWRNILITPIQIPEVNRAAGDFDLNGVVDITDFLFLLDNYQQPTVSPPMGINDLLALLDNWMRIVPS